MLPLHAFIVQIRQDARISGLGGVGWGGTVPQQGHNFDSSENDFFHLFSIFWDKIRTFLGNSRS